MSAFAICKPGFLSFCIHSIHVALQWRLFSRLEVKCLFGFVVSVHFGYIKVALSERFAEGTIHIVKIRMPPSVTFAYESEIFTVTGEIDIVNNIVINIIFVFLP